MQYNEIDFGDTLSEAFENYKKIFLLGGLVIFIYIMLSVITSLLVFSTVLGGSAIGGLGNLENLEDFLISLEDNLGWGPSLLTAVFSALLSALVGPMLYGILQMAKTADDGNGVDFEAAFVLYKKKYFVNAFLSIGVLGLGLGIINTVITQILPDLGDFLYAIIAAVVSVFFIFSIPFILFKNMNWLESYKASADFVGQNFAPIVGVLIVSGLFALVGLIGCVIGMLFTAPFVYSAQYMLFKNGVGFDSEVEIINQIGEKP